MHQIKAARAGCPEIICDFSIEQDYAYALSNLEPAEQPSFREVYREVLRQIKPTDLIIFLKCPTQILLEQIHACGRSGEATVDATYLESTVQSLRNHV